MRASSAISPAWLAPISITAVPCSGRSRSRVSGTPMWLLRLPSVASTGPRAAHTAASICLVVVLPLLPVTPITGREKPARQDAA